jgi:hypothetical protein
MTPERNGWMKEIGKALLLLVVLLVLGWIVGQGVGIKCIGDCSQPTAQELSPALTGHRTELIQYQILSGDVGRLGKTLYPYLWKAPFLPASLFLFVIIDYLFALTTQDALKISTPTGDVDAHGATDRRSLPAPWASVYACVSVLLYTLAVSLAANSTSLMARLALLILFSAIGAALQSVIFTVLRIARAHLKGEDWVLLPPLVAPSSGAYLSVVYLLLGVFCLFAASLFVDDTLQMRRTFLNIKAEQPKASAQPKPAAQRKPAVQPECAEQSNAAAQPKAAEQPNAAYDGTLGVAPRVFETIIDKEPRLRAGTEAECEKKRWADKVTAIKKTLCADGVPNDADMREIRDATISLTGEEPNLITQNTCRGGWYIISVVICVATCVFGVRKGRTWSTLFVVIASYLAIGLTFGVLYYDYYLLDASRYRALLETILTTSDVTSKAASSPPDSPYKGILSEARQCYATSPRMRYALQSGFFASSVFAQDSPQVTTDSNLPERFVPLADATFQFDLDSHEINPAFPLSFALKTSATQPKEVSDCAARAIVRWSGSQQTPQNTSNLTSAARLAAAVCAEAARAKQNTDLGYSMIFAAGADCPGDDSENERLSDDRLRAAREVVMSIVPFASDVAMESRPSTVDLKTAFVTAAKDAKSFTYPLRTVDGKCEAFPMYRLWPSAVPPRMSFASDPARAALVEIFRREADADNRVRMQSGLTRGSTLSDMVYFSFVTFTTTGYGDMKAVSGPVRFCVIMENILEILFTAIFFAAAMAVVTKD